MEFSIFTVFSTFNYFKCKKYIGQNVPNILWLPTLPLPTTSDIKLGGSIKLYLCMAHMDRVVSLMTILTSSSFSLCITDLWYYQCSPPQLSDIGISAITVSTYL